MQYLSLYLEFIKINLYSMIQYRVAYLTSTLAQALDYGVSFILIWVMIYRFGTLNGWLPYEVMFLYALSLCSYAIAGFFLFITMSNLSGMIQTGEFDEVLTKPMNPLLYLASRNFSPGYVSHIALSVAIMAVCLVNLEIKITPLKIAFLCLCILGAALIQGAAFLFTSVPSFWITQNRLKEILFHQLRSFIEYPISLYNKFVQVTLTLVIPYAFINFYPAQFFLGKQDFLMFNQSLQYLTPLIGLILFILAYKFWNFGLRHYKSTGT